MPHPISIQMYTVRDLTKTPDDYRRVIREIADIGYAGVEAGPPADMSAGDFRKFVEDLGMTVSSAWLTPTPEDVNKVVDTARALNVKHLVGCWGPNNFTSLAEIKKTAAHFQRAAELLKPHGLEMLYHNHWWEFHHKVDGRYGWDVLFELAPDVKCQLDLYWASNFGEVDVPAVARRYAARTPLVHAKDGPLVKDQPNTACGKGKLDLEAAIGAADGPALKWVIVELDNYVGGNANMTQAVRDSYTYLTRSGLARGRK
jgi:sugar phosphate isomerase/epimerase